MDDKNKSPNQAQGQSDISNEINYIVSNRVSQCSNTTLTTQIKKVLSVETSSIEKRGSLQFVLQEMSAESLLKKPKAKQRQISFQLPRKTIYSPKECVISGTEDKLLANSFVQKLPVPIEDKRYYRNSIVESLKRKPWYTEFSNFLALKYENFHTWFDFWQESLTAIEGQHGAAIVAYFLFLRWLLYMNVVIFLLNFCFLVMPQFMFTRADVINDNDTTSYFTSNSVNEVTEEYIIELDYYDPSRNSFLGEHTDHSNENITNNSSRDIIIKHCMEVYFKMRVNDTHRGFLAVLQSIFQGTGPLEQTLLFTGYYPPFNSIAFGHTYNVSVAFLCILIAVFIICIIMMVCYSSIGIQEAFVARNKHTNYYSNEIFSAWDYGINEEKTAEQQHYGFVLEMKTNLHEDRVARELSSRSTETWLKLYAIRFVINVFIFLWLFGCCYLIYVVAVYQLKEVHKHHLSKPGFRTFFIQFLPSITIVILNCISPTILDTLVAFEKYSAQTTVNLSLIRNVFLYLSSLIVLMNTVYQQITCQPKDICGAGLDKTCRSPRCWETYVGQQLFKLSITDMFVYFGVLLFYDLVQYFITHKFDNAITRFWGHPIFFLPTEVLAPINSQTILWLGVFYSPLLPAVMICKLIIIFYIKKFKISTLCDPSEYSYRTSRFNSAFMTILIISFIFVLLVQGFMIERIPPSRGCGPFRYFNTSLEAIPETIRYKLSGLMSYWSITFGTLVLCFFIHYYWRVLHTQRELLKKLKSHLVLESFDKQFLLKSLADLTGGRPTTSQNKQEKLFKRHNLLF